jgi:hypothetical protein
MNAQLELPVSRTPCPQDRAQGEIVHDERIASAPTPAPGSQDVRSTAHWWSDAWLVWRRTELPAPLSCPPAPAR